MPRCDLLIDCFTVGGEEIGASLADLASPTRGRPAQRQGPKRERVGLLPFDARPAGSLEGGLVGQVVFVQLGSEVSGQSEGVLRRAGEHHLGSGVGPEGVTHVPWELAHVLVGQDE
jgi:hypothetical protein